MKQTGSREYSHTNYITPGTKLHQIIKQDEILVNSVHHYYVNFKFDNLIINTRSIDGLIEGVELSNKKFIVGVQWHPEYFTDEPSTRLFNEFVKNL
ncbi:MAG: gamma-glutamyl-gamma-aminobutyrate hydrolase family protein [Candidatus Saccharibacteria bacterium]|nr:gamma-glutamyl-gamma-aminobutyrate hydrolase family protein [Candidatus Saccharibacteria bacterium]